MRLIGAGMLLLCPILQFLDYWHMYTANQQWFSRTPMELLNGTAISILLMLVILVIQATKK